MANTTCATLSRLPAPEGRRRLPPEGTARASFALARVFLPPRIFAAAFLFAEPSAIGR